MWTASYHLDDPWGTGGIAPHAPKVSGEVSGELRYLLNWRNTGSQILSFSGITSRHDPTQTLSFLWTELSLKTLCFQW